MTGGQWNLSGVLYQLLATLRGGKDAIIEEVRLSADEANVRIVVEPFSGGDAQVYQPGQTTVDQMKIRRGASPWRTREIVEKVLPDLFKAHRSRLGARLRFVTDNLNGTTALARLLAEIRVLKEQGRDAAALDTFERRFRWGQQHVSGATLFGHISASLNAPADEVWEFLAATEIEGLTEAQLTSEIDNWLAELVSEREEVPVKRKALVAHLLQLGTTGGSVSAHGFLGAVDINPAALTHMSALRPSLRAQVEEQAKGLRYDAEMDVRPTPLVADGPITILSGDQGQGKTWRLCRAALEVLEQGACALLLKARGDLASLETQIVEHVWGIAYDRPISLARVADRLRGKLSANDGVWLTVFLDDLTDLKLAEELAQLSWRRLGIRVVISAQHRITRMLTSQMEDLDEVAVGDFTLPELREYLKRAGRDPNLVPDDVLLALTKPVLASRYCVIPGSETWQAVSEYELMDRYWRWATEESKTQALHAADGAGVHRLAGVLLDGPVIYPWSPNTLIEKHVDAGMRDRLLEVGILRGEEAGAIAMTHDRVLNWAVAGEIARRFRDGELSVQGVADMLRKLDAIETQRGHRLGRRLGYVTHDVLWLLAQSEKPEDVGALALLLVCAGGMAAQNEEHFLEAGLGSLGPAIVPALAWMARQPYTKQERVLARLLPSAFLAVATGGAEANVSSAAVDLVRADVEQSRATGLSVLRSVPAPSAALDLLWDINKGRRIALEEAREQQPSDRTLQYVAKEQSFDALKCAAARAPDWIAAKARSVSDAGDAEQVIWLLLRLDLHVARPIWTDVKANLLHLSVDDATGPPVAIRRLADIDEMPRILDAVGKAKHPIAQLWFTALAALDPERALKVLGELPGDTLWGTSHWWLQRLLRKAGPRVLARLRETVGAFGEDDEEPALNELAILLANEQDLLDAETFDRIIDSLEACLAADVERAEPPKKTHSHLRRLIASASTPVLLQRLAARAGSHFEQLLAKRAMARPGRNSMDVDWNGEEYRFILGAIGGDGYDQVVLAEFERDNPHAKSDGVRAAVWTRNDQVRSRLTQIADQPDDDGYRRTQLMDALAAHRADDGLRAMVRNGSPIFRRSVDIRDGGPDWAPSDVGEVRLLLKSKLPEERRRGMGLSSFLRTDQAGELLRSVFADPNATDDEIAYARGVLSHLGYYEPAFLPRLARLLDHEEGGTSTARYLAWAGDESARAELAKWLYSHELKTLRSSELPVAFRLIRFADSAEAAKAFLKRVLAKGFGHGDEGEIYAALAEAGDNEAPSKLEAIAYQGTRRGAASLVSAIRALAKSSKAEAFAAAERFYHRTRSDAAAYLALELDPQRGMKLLLDLYLESRVPAQWDAARTLRWHAPKQELLAELSAHAASSRADLRKMAAEIAGWLPFEQSVPFLEKLADDDVEVVERAALSALRRRQADQDCATMILELPAQPRARQWAWLHAIVRCGDPDCLANAADPRALHNVLNKLGDEFRAEANRALQTRMRAVDKQAEDAERNSTRLKRSTRYSRASAGSGAGTAKG